MIFGQICEGWSNFCVGAILVKCQLWVKGFLNYISQVVYFLLVKFHQITIAQKGLQNYFINPKRFLEMNFLK
jgi:hypothetical protein